MRLWPTIVCAAVTLWAAPAAAICVHHPLAHATRSVRALGQPHRLVQLGAAIAAPLALAPSGLDHTVRTWAQRDLGGRYDLEATSLVVPYALSAAALAATVTTALFGDCEGTRIGSALLQSVVVAAAVSATLKGALGRAYPTGGGDPYAADRLEDASRATTFRPGRDFGAWPSGHSAVSFAFAAALRATLPRAGLLRYAGYAIATGVGLGMIAGDHHWASDVVSGALLGEAIGGAIGTGFRNEPSSSSTWLLVPRPGGAAMVGTF